MSLAWRILLLALLLNVITVGSVQVVVHLSQQNWFSNQRQLLQDSVNASFEELERVYSASQLRSVGSDTTVTRRLLANGALHELYDDIIVTSGLPPYEVVYLNLAGAVHRDPATFPNDVITAGMVKAREFDGGIVPVADGFCRALRQAGAVVGYLWFKPKHLPTLPRALPLWTSISGVAASTLLFGLVLFWVTRAAIRTPLQAISEAAAAVAMGRYDVHVPAGHAVPELGPLLQTFNRMAAQVSDHTRTLERAVHDAVEQTKQQERALVLSSRLASIGTLAAGVAHEINNPIGGMQNAVNRLLQSQGLADRQRTYLQLVQDGLQRIARTTRRLLDFSPRQVAAGNFPLATAVEGARALVEHRVQVSGVSLTVELPADLPMAFGDPHEIQQVVLNLLLNSLDVMEPRGGSIRVHARSEGGWLHLHVDDDGPGMAPQDLGRVFDPFFSKKDRPDASGLGLFICFSIVRNHGGEITVDSKPGEGFRVHIVLPQAAA